MKRILSRASLIWLVLVIIIGFVVTQGYFIWTDYARFQLGIVKRYSWITSIERSSLLTLKPSPGMYLRFLNLYIPTDAPIVLSPASETGTLFRQQLLSSQSIMQFYLFPRPIWLCVAYNSKCINNLTNPKTFVLAIGNFPLPEYMEGKIFVPFLEPVENIKGVYAPAQLAQSLSVPSTEIYSH